MFNALKRFFADYGSMYFAAVMLMVGMLLIGLAFNASLARADGVLDDNGFVLAADEVSRDTKPELASPYEAMRAVQLGGARVSVTCDLTGIMVGAEDIAAGGIGPFDEDHCEMMTAFGMQVAVRVYDVVAGPYKDRDGDTFYVLQVFGPMLGDPEKYPRYALAWPGFNWIDVPAQYSVSGQGSSHGPPGHGI